MNFAATARAALNYYRGRRDVFFALNNDGKSSFMREPLELSVGRAPRALKAIERRRHQLLNDKSTISIIDFGAGKSTDARSHQVQDQGVKLQSSVADVARASKPVIWSRMLYFLTKSAKPNNVLEMGTCVGISGAYIASAIKENGGGNLISLEGNPESAEISKETFRHLGLSDYASVIVGPFHSTLDAENEKDNFFDLVFVDGHHDGEATVAYFERLRPHLSNRAIMVFDDIRWSKGMFEGWQRITRMPNIEVVDMGAMGAIRVHEEHAA